MGRVVVGSCFAATWLCVATLAHADDGPGGLHVQTPTQGIYGGENTLTCEWPTAVEMGGCTGTLVHPEVVIYAAHCGGSVPSVYFGESPYGSGGRSVQTEFCQTMPGAQPGWGTDFAVCKLAEPVTDVQIVPILMGCETELLTPGREVVLVGFGQTESGGSGTKKEVVTTLDHITNDEAFLGGGGLAPCYGDSGGPAYVKLPASEGFDDTWRVFGVTSHGDQVCGGGGYYGMMHNAIDWFESTTGVDITPCHDADGTWNPGEDCVGFPLSPGTSTGSWDSWCEDVPVGPPSATCGDPGVDVPSEPPTVRIIAPADGDDFEPDGAGQAQLEVLVDANDIVDDEGVAHVELLVDGVSLGTDDTEPYAFDVTVDEGQHTFEATATDVAGNVSDPDSIAIVVGEGDDGGGVDGGGGPDDDDDDAGDAGDDDDDAADAGDDDDDGDGGFDPEGDPGLPPGFGANDDLAGCGCRSPSSPAPRGAGWALVGLVALIRRRR